MVGDYDEWVRILVFLSSSQAHLTSNYLFLIAFKPLQRINSELNSVRPSATKIVLWFSNVLFFLKEHFEVVCPAIKVIVTLSKR